MTDLPQTCLRTTSSTGPESWHLCGICKQVYVYVLLFSLSVTWTNQKAYCRVGVQVHCVVNAIEATNVAASVFTLVQAPCLVLSGSVRKTVGVWLVAPFPVAFFLSFFLICSCTSGAICLLHSALFSFSLSLSLAFSVWMWGRMRVFWGVSVCVCL